MEKPGRNPLEGRAPLASPKVGRVRDDGITKFVISSAARNLMLEQFHPECGLPFVMVPGMPISGLASIVSVRGDGELVEPSNHEWTQHE